MRGKRLPYVIVFVTMSADGKIASPTRDSRLSCPADKRMLHELRASSDAVVVGAGTVISDNPLLTVRLVKGVNPLRVILDGRLSIPLSSAVVTDGSAKTFIAACSGISSDSKVAKLREAGCDVRLFKCVDGHVPIKDLLACLQGIYGVRKVLVEGGGETIWRFFKEGLVDEFRVTISPFIIGGKASITPVEGDGFPSLGEWVRLRLIHVVMCECGNEVHLIYRVVPRIGGDPEDY